MSHPTNTQFAIGVHLLSLLATDPGQLHSSDEMAVSVVSNPVHIRRVLGRLRAAGIVASRPGPHGGWGLLRDPVSVRLGEIWRAVEALDHVVGLHAPDPACPIGCRVREALVAVDRRAVDAFMAELDSTTVADVLAAADGVRARAAS